MGNYIKKVKVNLLDGRFTQEIAFSSGLNIIAGANGACKTKLLEYIQLNKSNNATVELSIPGQNVIIAQFSPKRNAQKVLMEQAQQLVRQDINAEQNALNAFINQQLQDDNIQTIKSISEYLTLSSEKIVDQGNKTKEQATKEIKQKYQEVLSKVFDYKINLSWDSSRRYISNISKNGDNLEFNQLSSGENAIISLVFAVFYVKDTADIYLIDEPEIHLNWLLEEKLFGFFDWFAQTYNKQIIIVTHSRACFIKPYVDFAQFFVWENGNTVIKNKPDQGLIEALSGDIVKVVNGITAEDKLIYVEDKKQKHVIGKISELLPKKIEIVDIGNCEKVKTQAKAFKMLNVNNVSFLIDGDNKPMESIERADYHSSLVQLDKYCIENYFLDTAILAIIDKSNPKKDISSELFNTVKEISNQSFAPVKALLTSKDSLTKDVLDRLDASIFVKNLARRLGYNNESELMDAYITEVNRQGKLNEFFPEIVNKILI